MDGIDLMLRAARKALRSVDPEIEAAAQRAVTRLQELDARTVEPIRKHMASIDTGRIDRLASDVGREMAGFVERIAHRIESEIDASRK